MSRYARSMAGFVALTSVATVGTSLLQDELGINEVYAEDYITNSGSLTKDYKATNIKYIQDTNEGIYVVYTDGTTFLYNSKTGTSGVKINISNIVKICSVTGSSASYRYTYFLTSDGSIYYVQYTSSSSMTSDLANPTRLDNIAGISTIGTIKDIISVRNYGTSGTSMALCLTKSGQMLYISGISDSTVYGNTEKPKLEVDSGSSYISDYTVSHIITGGQGYYFVANGKTYKYRSSNASFASEVYAYDITTKGSELYSTFGAIAYKNSSGGYTIEKTTSSCYDSDVSRIISDVSSKISDATDIGLITHKLLGTSATDPFLVGVAYVKDGKVAITGINKWGNVNTNGYTPSSPSNYYVSTYTVPWLNNIVKVVGLDDGFMAVDSSGKTYIVKTSQYLPSSEFGTEDSSLTYLVEEAERCMKEELSVPMNTAYNTAYSAVNSSSSSLKSSLLSRLSVVNTYYTNKFKPAEDSVVALESLGTITESNLADAKSKLATATSLVDALTQTANFKNTVTLRNRITTVSNDITQAENDIIQAKKDKATADVTEAERCMKEELEAPMKSACDTAKLSVDALDDGEEKSSLLNRLSIVESYHDDKFKPAEDSVKSVESLGEVTTENVATVRNALNEAKEKIGVLESSYKNTNTLLDRLSSIETDVELKEQGATATASVDEALRAMKEELSTPMLEAYNTAKSDVDNLPSSESSLITSLNDKLTQVKTYYDKFKPIEDDVKEVVSLVDSLTTSNVSDVRSKYNSTLSELDTLEQDYKNTETLRSMLSSVDTSISDKEKEKEDEIRLVESNAESLVEEAERQCVVDTSVNFASLKTAYDNADSAVSGLSDTDSATKKLELRGRLDTVNSYYGRLLEAESKVIIAETEDPKSQSTVDGARAFINDSTGSVVLDPTYQSTIYLLDRLSDVQADIDYTNKINDIESLVKKAEDGRYTDLAKDLRDKYDIASTKVEELGSSDSSYSGFKARLDAVNDYLVKLQSAEDKIGVAETNLTLSDVEIAEGYINANLEPTADNTKTLLRRLDAVREIIAGNEALRQASEAVKKAEETMTYTDFDKAQELVSALPSSDGKSALRERLNKLKDKMQELLDDAKKAVTDAEANPTTDTVQNGYTKVNKLPDDCSEKQGLLDRLNNLKDMLDEADKEKLAEKAVEKAEDTLKSEDIQDARDKVNDLKDGEKKNELNKRLDDAEDLANKIQEAEKAVEKAEETIKQKDVDDARVLVDVLPDSDVKTDLENRLDEVQKIIDNLLQEATKAVEKVEQTLSRGDYDLADRLVNALEDSADKDALRGRLDSVLDKMNSLIADATEKVENAEQTPSRELVEVAQSAIDKLPSDYVEKQELQDRLNKVIANLDAKDLEDLAIKAVEKAEETKDLSDINSAQDLVNRLPDGDLKDELQSRIDKLLNDLNLQELIDKATKAVEKAEAERTQISKDEAQKLVNMLPNGDIKSNLQARLDAIIIGSTVSDLTQEEMQQIFEGIVNSYKPTNNTYEDDFSNYVSDTFTSKTGITISVSIKDFKKVDANKYHSGTISGKVIGVVTLSNNNSVQLVTDANLVITKLSSSSSSGKKHSTDTTNKATFSLLGITRDNIASDIDVLSSTETVESGEESLLSTGNAELKIVNVPYLEKIPTEDGSVNGTMQLLNDGNNTVGMLLTGDKAYSDNTVVNISTNVDADDLKVYTYIDELNKYVHIDTNLSNSSEGVSFKGTGKKKYLLSTIDLSNDVTANQGWNKLDGENWTYVDGQDVANNWVTDTDSNKYYIDSNTNKMQTGWLQQGDDWFYLNPISDGYKGAMKTGWQSTKTDWYYMNSEGKMQTGWVQDRGTWYYLNPVSDGNKGAMTKDWKQIDGTWYYFDSNGALVENN